MKKHLACLALAAFMAAAGAPAFAKAGAVPQPPDRPAAVDETADALAKARDGIAQARALVDAALAEFATMDPVAERAAIAELRAGMAKTSAKFDFQLDYLTTMAEFADMIAPAGAGEKAAAIAEMNAKVTAAIAAAAKRDAAPRMIEL